MVLTALKGAGLLENTTEEPNSLAEKRPIDVHVNAGIVLKGSKNTVCTGLPKLVKPPAAGAAAGVGTAKGKPQAERGEHSMAAESQKRRACSVRDISK